MTVIRTARVFTVIAALLVAYPAIASAHQPREVTTTQVSVPSPEVSKAYYGILAGTPHVFSIEATSSFDLYVNILVPRIESQKKDVRAVVAKDGIVLADLGGPGAPWTDMFEVFGYDWYWQGPEFKQRAEAGTYTITVSSANNDSKYSLAVGEIEQFDLTETMNALTLVPKLKRTFFEESPITFILSPFGIALIVITYVLAAIVGLIYRAVLLRVARSRERSAPKNIGSTDRISRLLIGAALLLFAITTTWNPIVLFFSGFAFFEAIFSWCGLYAAIGKNTCPVE